MQHLPASLALRGTLLRRPRDIVGWHRYGDRPARQRHGLLALPSINLKFFQRASEIRR